METDPFHGRRHQLFPVLDSKQTQVARRFASGVARRFAPGEAVYRAGDPGPPAWFVDWGDIELTRKDGAHGEAPILSVGVGQFTGEINQLSGRPAIASAQAGPEGCAAFPLDRTAIRALVIGSAEIGEIVMRAFILRRVSLLEKGAGSVLLGHRVEPALVRLQDFLTRAGFPFTTLEASRGGEGHALIERLGVAEDELPLVVCPNGDVLRRPSLARAALCLGITPALDEARPYDVAVVGGGPAGLATAVYAASEGLSVVVLESFATGGQAGASSRIENYLGFPTGISGRALTGRAVTQAFKFGATIAAPIRVDGLRRSKDDGTDAALFHLGLDNGAHVRARSVVAASGARYRKLDVPNLADFEGAGVFYWASPIEGSLCAGEEIALVGGGNSAGQAIVYLSPLVKTLHLIVRADDLAKSMSAYLIERIAALENVQIHFRSEVVGLDGDPRSGLAGVVFRDADGAERRRDLRHLFLFLGAEPNSDWLRREAALDERGYVRTGSTNALPHETDVPRLFAIGDVRSGSTKRVAAAVGEGASVVAELNQVLSPSAGSPTA